MSAKFTSLLALSAGFALTLELVSGSTAQAAQFTYDFTATADSGPFTGEMASGFFSFSDDEPPIRMDLFSSFYLVSQAEFIYAGESYTLADADAPVEAATSADGEFLGLNYASTTLPFSLVPGFTEASQGFFAYEAGGQGGAGSLDYVLREDQPTESVPEPSALVGLGLLSAGLLLKKNMRTQQEPKFSA